MRTASIVLFALLLARCAQQKEQETPEGEHGPWTLTRFVKVDSLNPVLQPDPGQVFACPVSRKTVAWEARNVLNPAAVVREGKVYLLYRAQDAEMTSRLGLATSDDGLHFQKGAAPVFYPAEDSLQPYEWKGGVEDPRIVESEDGTYILTYTAYDGKVARLCLATSKDLHRWTKHGPVLRGPAYRNTWSKSGAIVVRQEGHRMVAARIQGKYWMYFGDTDLFMATSDDLVHWNVLEGQEHGRMVSVLHPRPGFFDSRLVEPGPFALLRKEGILLIYNGSNAANYNDTTLPRFTYSAGQALFDAALPYKLKARTDSHFLHPDKPYERVGEVNEVCFVEGLVFFRNRWLLYYGTADSKIAVAVRDSHGQQGSL